jgi:hypothetical protein
VTGPAGAPGGVTGSIEILAPAVPGAGTVVRLQAQLSGGAATGATALVTSALGGERRAPQFVAPGTYTLTYVDENGAPTTFQTSVAVGAGQAAVVRVGAVQVAFSSAVHTDRTGTQALTYRIGNGGAVLRTVRADLGTTVILPPGAWTWAAVGGGGDELPGITLNVAPALVSREWGSVFVRKRAGDAVSLRTATGLVVLPQASDGVEYLLPATDQAHGCMVYLGIVNQLTTDTITLCQDAVLHADLRTR